MSDELSILKEQLNTLYKVNTFMTQIGDIKSLILSIMQESSETVQAEASSVALYDSQTDELYFEVALGEKKAEIEKLRIKNGIGIIGEVSKKGEPLNIDDVSKDPRFNSSVDDETKFKTRSILAVPIKRQDNIIGVIEVLNKKDGQCFTDSDMRLLEIIASQAAIAIENAKLYKELFTKHEELLDTHKQLLEAQEQLINSERLSAIGRMASGIIHDFKNPMAAIRSFCEMLSAGMLTPEESNKYSVRIMGEIDRFVGMTRELLEFARGKITLNIKPCDIKGFIDSTVAFVEKDLASQSISITTDLKYDGEVMMDDEKMSRVLFNLLGNSKDAMPEGGAILVSTVKEGDRLVMSIKDSGCGIPDAIKETLFEAFVTHGKKHGTGLGLAIIKKIVTDHGGRINVYSPARDGQKGAEFVIDLPLSR